MFQIARFSKVGLRFQTVRSYFGLIVALLAWTSTPLHAQTAGAPFTCDVVFYQIRNDSSGTTASNVFGFPVINNTVTPINVYSSDRTNVELNAIGYNPVDNYMYGLANGVNPPTMYRIGQTGYELVGTIAAPPAGSLAGWGNPTAGAFDAGGRYYFAGQGTTNGVANSIAPNAIYRVDAIPSTGNMTAAQQYNISIPNLLNLGDFDFNGAGGTSGLLLGASKQGGAYGDIPTMVRITLAPSGTGVGVANVVTSTLAGLTTATAFGIGSAFWDSAANGGLGRFYVFDNGLARFWEIFNAESGSASASSLTVTFPSLAPWNTSTFGVSPTDGTSCPISGTRRADLAVVKSDFVGTVTTNSVTAYSITVTNAGPYPANYTTVRDPAAPGLQKLSVTCSAPVGPPTAVCPAILSVAAIESPGGVQVITFPPETTLVFTINAQVTATSGLVTNTVTVTPAVDTIDGTLTNNTSVDVNVISGSAPNVSSTASICPAATTVERLGNLLTTGSFTGAFGNTAAIVGGLNTFQSNTAGVPSFVALQSGTTLYTPSFVIRQNPFPGDVSRSVAGGPNWMLANSKFSGGNYNVWQQAVGGLEIGKTYQFFYYVSNATAPGATAPSVPAHQLQVTSNTGTFTINASTSVPVETTLTDDRWTLVQATFTAAVSTVTLSISDLTVATGSENGGVAAFAQVHLRACDPFANVGVTKTNGQSFVTSNAITTYTLTVSNPTAITATNTLIVDPAVPNFIKTSVSCTPSGTSLCPTPTTATTVLNLEGAGLVIPRLSPNSTVTFIVGGTVTGGAGNTLTNIVSISPIGYIDPDTSNNQAQDADPIQGAAALSITKTNTVTSLVAGQTTSYIVTVANAGPSAVTNALFRDVPSAGLQCTSISCAVIGAGSCPLPAALTVANMTGSGIQIPSLPSPSSSVRFTINCNVTATGVP
jgi:uncharacterized repeat protein (TIGR01451 family)